MDVGVLGGLDDLVHGDFPEVVSIGDVLSDGGVKERRLLTHDPHLSPQPLQVQVTDIVTVKHLGKRDGE